MPLWSMYSCFTLSKKEWASCEPLGHSGMLESPLEAQGLLGFTAQTRDTPTPAHLIT